MNYYSFIEISLISLFFNDNSKICKLKVFGVSEHSIEVPLKTSIPLLPDDLKIQPQVAVANK